MTQFDLLVIGGGNAALCAAITAAEADLSVCVLEVAPKFYRGGNSRHTRNFRCGHDQPMSVLTDAYEETEYFDDLLRVTAGNTDETLARLCIRESAGCLPWMEKQGVRFQPSLSGTLSLSRTNAFFLGGGRALVNAYYKRLSDLGVKVVYEAEVEHLELENRVFKYAEVSINDTVEKFSAKAVVVASGGFQANLEWLAEAWGPAARNFLIRGTPYNRGKVLKDLVDQGIDTVGDPTQCHAVAIDGRAPKFDGGIVTRLDCVPFSIVVNNQGERFYDEGEDLWPKRYAIWGRLVAAQPDQIAYSIIDAKSRDLFMPSVFKPVMADSIAELARKISVPAEMLTETIENFNAACVEGAFHPTTLDGVKTEGLDVNKTNWARPITEPPFMCYELRPGVTFTYLGLKVDTNAQVQSPDGPIENMWAAGEIMAGSILGQGYLAGFGMTIGTVFGRIAGREAAAYVK